VASTLPQADWYFSGSAKELSTDFEILADADRRHQAAVPCHQSSLKFGHLVCARNALDKTSGETGFEMSPIKLMFPLEFP
jgi:hypothetical protein